MLIFTFITAALRLYPFLVLYTIKIMFARPIFLCNDEAVALFIFSLIDAIETNEKKYLIVANTNVPVYDAVIVTLLSIHCIFNSSNGSVTPYSFTLCLYSGNGRFRCIYIYIRK